MPAYGDPALAVERLVLTPAHLGGVSVYEALPQPEASFGFHCSIWLVRVGWSPCMVWVQRLGFSGLIIGVFVERVGDLVCDVFAGWGVDVDGGDRFGLGGVEVGGHGFGFLSWGGYWF